MSTNLIIMIVMFASLGVLGIFMSISIKNYEKKQKMNKKKKGRLKYVSAAKKKA